MKYPNHKLALSELAGFTSVLLRELSFLQASASRIDRLYGQYINRLTQVGYEELSDLHSSELVDTKHDDPYIINNPYLTEDGIKERLEIRKKMYGSKEGL